MSNDISGFPEFLPNEQIAFNAVVDKIRQQFELFGFVPMDTPAVERLSTLLAKGNDNEIYGIYRVADGGVGKKDLGLRFDLTVPFARYVVSKLNDLTFPHKRYQISPVWRGERPQFGRYRQFYQCDIDIVGNGSLSLTHDAEIVYLITETIKAIGIQNFTTRINNIKILNGFLKNIASPDIVPDITKIVDKVEKISSADFVNALKETGMSKESADKLISFIDVTEKREDSTELIKWLYSIKQNEEFLKGVAELEEVLQTLRKWGLEEKFTKVSMKLARGLNYYTGTIFETTFDGIDDFGSIAGGGRYENLTATLSSDKVFPGVGASIGVSRLVPKLLEKGLLTCDRHTPADLLITVQNRELLNSYMRIATRLRKIGIKTEVYLQNKSLSAQMNYANKKGFRYVLIANDMELLESKAIIRNLVTKKQTIIRTEFVGNEILELMKD